MESLKINPKRKLDQPRIVGLTTYFTVIARTEVAGNVTPEPDTVEGIEEIRSEFNVPRLAKVSALDNAEIFIEVCKPSHIPIGPRRVSESEVSGKLESGWVEIGVAVGVKIRG